MADSIQSFVRKLQEEGVQAGRAEAQKLMDEARQQAERIVADAKAQAQETLDQGREELALAARDVLLRLRQTITRALEAVLRQAAAERLADSGFLSKLLHDVVMQYAEKDAEGDSVIEIRVSDEELQGITDWALKEIAQEQNTKGHRLELKGRLKTAGFEYSVGQGTVEMTPESIAAVLSQMIAPRLRAVIDEAAAQGQ